MLLWLEVAAFAYFVLVWWGFSGYAKRRARMGNVLSLSRSLRDHRNAWTERMMWREIRMTDASLLANQERVVGFFASTTLLLLAAVLTAITNAQQIIDLTQQMAWFEGQVLAQLEIKLGLLLLILIYAFFKITWALRQYGFASVLVGSAPMPEENVSAEERHAFAQNLARLMDAAGHDNNSCLRSYYFMLAMVFWFVGPLQFIIATTFVVLILANREFRSSTIACISDAYIAPDKDSLSAHSRRGTT
ncbi:DUF599 domain-containing protein [Flavobacteriaceae bacterium]|nr:DUF599 domain-containing protein [Flavobacteriaceae bacterium]